MKKGDISLAASLKVEGGLRLAHMQRFFMKDGFSYSLKEE